MSLFENYENPDAWQELLQKAADIGVGYAAQQLGGQSQPPAAQPTTAQAAPYAGAASVPFYKQAWFLPVAIVAGLGIAAIAFFRK